MDAAWEMTSIQRKEREGNLVCAEAMRERLQLCRQREIKTTVDVLCMCAVSSPSLDDGTNAIITSASLYQTR